MHRHYKAIKKLRHRRYSYSRIATLFGLSSSWVYKIANPSDKLSGRDYVREQARIRDKHTCQKCGKKWKKGQRRFDVHHLNGKCGKMSRGYDRLDEISGLITYCHSCHLNLESVIRKMRAGWKPNSYLLKKWEKEDTIARNYLNTK